ncbi:MAG: PAS domain-containing protein, partial [Bdellovibrionales bacterium]
MPKTNTIKQQRDRFLAFAFACADLFLEISETGEIVFATGAAKGMTGIDDQALIGKNWLELFENNHTPALTSMKDSAKPAMRCGPLFVTLNKKITDQQGIVTGIRMLPPDNHFYITLSLSRALMEKLAEIIQRSPELQPAAPAQAQARPPPPVTTDFTPEDEEFDDTIYNKQSFLDEADKTFEFAKTQNIDADVTVFDFGRTQTLPEEDWAGMMAEMAKYLRSQSLDNSAPG